MSSSSLLTASVCSVLRRHSCFSSDDTITTTSPTTAVQRDTKKFISDMLATEASICDYSISPLGEEGSAGFVNTTERINICYDNDADSRQLPNSLIIKSEGGFNESFDKMARRINANEQECNFYKELAPSLQEVSSLKLPKIYHATKNILVMEDLSQKATVVNQEEGMSMDLMNVAVLTAAEFHAPYWGAMRSSELPQYVPKGGEGNGWLNLIKEKSQSVYSMKGFLGDEIDNSSDIGLFIHAHADKITEHACSTEPQTLIHADYRGGNFMQVNGTNEMYVLDWQTYCSGLGLYDVAYLIIGSMEIQGDSTIELLRTYKKRLEELGIDYKWDDLWRDFRVCILQMAFMINYAFEGVVQSNEDRRIRPDTPEILFCCRRRIIAAIRRYECCDESLLT